MYNLYDKTALRVDLDKEMTRKFEVYKTAKGLQQNTEAVRLLINEAYHTLFPIDAQVAPEQKVPV